MISPLLMSDIGGGKVYRQAPANIAEIFRLALIFSQREHYLQAQPPKR